MPNYYRPLTREELFYKLCGCLFGFLVMALMGTIILSTVWVVFYLVYIALGGIPFYYH